MDFKIATDNKSDDPSLQSSQQAEGNKVFGQQFDPNQSKFNPDNKDDGQAMARSHQLKKIWLWLTILIVALGVGAGGWWYYNNRIEDSLPPTTNQNETTTPVNTESVPDANLAQDNQSPETSTDTDDDQDGLTLAEEINLGTDPNLADTDGDTYLDGQEVSNGYNPLGAGLLNPENNPTKPINTYVDLPGDQAETFALDTPQNTVEAMAYAINNNDTELFIRIISPNNTIYNDVVADPASYLNIYQYSFNFKQVRFEITSELAGETPDFVTLNTDVYLDDVFFQPGSATKLEKINGEWKVLQ